MLDASSVTVEDRWAAFPGRDCGTTSHQAHLPREVTGRAWGYGCGEAGPDAPGLLEDPGLWFPL